MVCLSRVEDEGGCSSGWCGGGGAGDAIHSLRWSGSKNKQGFLSLTPFTERVMSLGPGMGAL